MCAQAPGFEVASVKPNTSDPRAIPNVLLSGGRYVASAATLRSIIEFAYRPLLGRQIVGGPSWIESTRYDIRAKGEGNPSADTLRLMLRSLLAERFMLRVHSETRDTPIYALALARGDRRPGPQLKPGSVDCSARRGDAPPPDAVQPPVPSPECGFFVRTTNIVGVGVQLIELATGVTISQLAAQLSAVGLIGRPVLDRTGLAGTYDIEFTFGVDSAGGRGLGDASIFTALREQLGLELAPTTAQVEFLVIDGVERPGPD